MEALELIERLSQYKSDRGNFPNLWQECADYGMPGNRQYTTKQSPGSQQEDTFQTVAESCIIELAAGLYSYMFPTDSKAFILAVDDEELSDNDNVKQYLSKVTDTIHTYLTQSNFRHTFFEFLKSLAGIGTACFYSGPGKKKKNGAFKKSVINFHSFHMSTVYIDIDDELDVDTVFREFEYTAKQAVQKFGKDNLGDLVLKAYEDPKQMSSEKFTFLHACFPNDDADGKNTDSLTMDYISYYVDVADKLIIKQKGFDHSGEQTAPYQVVRFDKDALEMYGRSPMMKMLSDVKMLSQLRFIRVKAWDKMCDPPLVLPDDGSIWPLSTAPGSVLHILPSGEKPFWFEFKGNLAGINDAVDKTTTDIKEGFFLDLFDLPQDDSVRTATEILARMEQKLRKLTPIIGRLQSELFNLLIERIISVLGEAGKLPEIPEELKGKDNIKIEYLGKIALVLKALEVQGFVITMEQLMPIIEKQGAEQALNQITDNFDLDKTARNVARANGVPATWIRQQEDVDEIRNQKSQQQNILSLVENVPGLAKALESAGKAPEAGSLGEQIQNAA
jgi:hypothetical protein